MNAMPFDSLLPGSGKRSDIRLRSTSERRVPVRARPHRRENARRSTDMIGMWMRQHECFQRATSSKNVRKHSRAPGIATAPGGTRIQQNPVSAVRSNQDRVALAHVQEMDLDPVTPREGKRG